MNATMENIRDMVDVNTVIGDPVTANDGTTIIPISRVSFGFVAGGGEYEIPGKKQAPPQNGGGAAGQGGQPECLPFAGGAGAGVSVSPVGFLVVSSEQVRLLPAQPLRAAGPHHRAGAPTGGRHQKVGGRKKSAARARHPARRAGGVSVSASGMPFLFRRYSRRPRAAGGCGFPINRFSLPGKAVHAIIMNAILWKDVLVCSRAFRQFSPRSF
jgi:sporulation protein YtfJ